MEARAGRAAPPRAPAPPAARGAHRAEREPQDRVHRRGARAVLLRRSVTSHGVVMGQNRTLVDDRSLVDADLMIYLFY